MSSDEKFDDLIKEKYNVKGTSSTVGRPKKILKNKPYQVTPKLAKKSTLQTEKIEIPKIILKDIKSILEEMPTKENRSYIRNT